MPQIANTKAAIKQKFTDASIEAEVYFLSANKQNSIRIINSYVAILPQNLVTQALLDSILQFEVGNGYLVEMFEGKLDFSNDVKSPDLFFITFREQKKCLR